LEPHSQLRGTVTSCPGNTEEKGRFRPKRWQIRLFGQNEFALSSATEPVDLPAALDPNFFATSSQLFEGNYFGHSVRHTVSALPHKFFVAQGFFFGIALRVVGHQKFSRRNRVVVAIKLVDSLLPD